VVGQEWILTQLEGQEVIFRAQGTGGGAQMVSSVNARAAARQPPAPRPLRPAPSTQIPACAKFPIMVDLIPQISRAYSAIVRSDENFPIRAMFSSDFRRHAARSR